MNKRLSRQYDATIRDLQELILLTKRRIENCKTGNEANLAALVNEQRHNFKVLLRNLRRMER